MHGSDSPESAEKEVRIIFGNEGIFYQETKSAIYNEKKRPSIYGYIAGLGGRDVLQKEIMDIAEDASRPGAKSDITWVGVKR